MKVAIVLACMMALAAAVEDVAVADQTAAEQRWGGYGSYGHGVSRSFGGYGYGHGGYSRGYGGHGYGYGHSRRGRSVEAEVAEVDTTPEEYSSQRWGGRSYYGGYGHGYNRYNNYGSYNGYNSYNRYNNYGSYPSHYNRGYYGGWY